MMPANAHILISGAGIAGLTLAYWLQHFGFQPVLVERRSDLHDEGYMIDFYGSGYDVAEKMGLLDQLHDRHYPVPKLEFVNRQGKVRATFELDQFRKLLHYRHYNFMRGDLADVLFQDIKDRVPIRFGTTITGIQNGPGHVTVELSNGAVEEYALVIGADGIHSAVRGLLWGSESQFEDFLGYYVACSIIENFLGGQTSFYSYIEPKKQASVYPIRGGRLATFLAFKSPRHARLQRPQQHMLLQEIFGGMGWEVPQMLAAMEASPNFYFDAVSQIKLASWYQGRVALVGDACQCLTFLAGQGASMAMAGAYFLATELHRANGDYGVAFPAYQARLKPEIEERQVQARGLASSFVPNNRLSIAIMYLFLKAVFLPGLRDFFLRQVGTRSIIK